MWAGWEEGATAWEAALEVWETVGVLVAAWAAAAGPLTPAVEPEAGAGVGAGTSGPRAEGGAATTAGQTQEQAEDGSHAAYRAVATGSVLEWEAWRARRDCRQPCRYPWCIRPWRHRRPLHHRQWRPSPRDQRSRLLAEVFGPRSPLR